MVLSLVEGDSTLYQQAMKLAKAHIPKPIVPGSFEQDRIWNIPQYLESINNYDYQTIEDTDGKRIMESEIIPLLEHAAEDNDVDALVTLGDIYLFGNMSMPTNYSRARDYYHQAVDIRGHGHAYFMLGFIYSTGMFGELESNQGKALLFYQLAVEQNDMNAMLALAYRTARGIGTPRNCDMALMYYSKLSHLGFEYLMNHEHEIEPTDVDYNVRIPDFHGGIYGEEVSESGNSVYVSKKKILHSYEQEYSIDNFDKKIVLNYFSALDEYSGYYDSPKNFTRAKELLQDCTNYGETLYGYKHPQALSNDDRIRLSQCQALLGHMYFKGQGTEQDYSKAFKYLKDLTRLFNTSDAANDLALIYEKGLVNNDVDEHKALEYYSVGIKSGSEKANRNLAKFLISKIPYGDLISSNQKSEIVRMMQKAAMSGDTEALYRYSEFIQSGFTDGVFGTYTCERTLIYPRVFIERLQEFAFPHLKYALEQLANANYKNALVGYLIAAEQGLERAQVSAGWLLYQPDPLSMKGKKHLIRDRVLSAMKYYKRASDEGDIDSTIFLGDIYLHGIESVNITKNYEKAFELYSKAAHSESPHACFSLAYMYEHGLGVVNGTVDYFMAKRYYDLSLTYKELHGITTNNIPIYFTLLKLRIKYLFSGKSRKLVPDESSQSSWFSNFKKLGTTEQEGGDNSFLPSERAQQRAREQHEGGDSSYFIDDDIAIGDYFVLGITFVIFMALLIKNLVQQYRRMRDRDGNNHGNVNEQPNDARPEGWNFNGNGVDFRRGNFEFHFFAL